MAEPGKTKGVSSGRFTEQVKAVSIALKANQTLLNRPLSPARINLPEVARTIDDVVGRADSITVEPVRPEGDAFSFDSLQGKRSESDPATDSREAETPWDRKKALESSNGHRPSGAGQTETESTTARPLISSSSVPIGMLSRIDKPISVGQEQPVSASEVAIGERSIEPSNRTERGIDPDDRSSPMTSVRASNQGSHELVGIGVSESRPGIGPVIGGSGPPDSTRSQGTARPSGLEGHSVPSKAAALPEYGGRAEPQLRLPDNAGVQNLTARVDRSTSAADHPFGPTIRDEPPMEFVRNPLSTNFADFSEPGPALPNQNGSGPDRGGIGQGPGGLDSGGSPPSAGGTTIDLSRTNELLQQLLDAVRKQRGSSLPPGGPSVYPDR